MERVQRKSRDEWRRKIQQDKRFMRNRIVTVILPVLKEWSQRGHKMALPFRMTQVLTRHSCHG